jgi:hypothetical protein
MESAKVVDLARVPDTKEYFTSILFSEEINPALLNNPFDKAIDNGNIYYFFKDINGKWFKVTGKNINGSETSKGAQSSIIVNK